MRIQFPTFIGRVEQLEEIKQQIERWDQTVAVNIAGAGGVGKTTLLRRLRDGYKDQPKILVTDVIDFSHTVHRVESWVLEQIIAIQPSGFPTLREKLSDLDKLEPLARLYQEREALAALEKDYNLLARDHRIILLFDTLELIQESPLLEFLLNLASRLKNTVLILAGRRNDEPLLKERLKASLGPGRMLTFRLGGFTENEAKLYFSRTETPLAEIHDDLRKNIYLLSEGSPIKIALSLDWLSRGIPLMPEITHMRPEELEHLAETSPSEMKALQKSFEYALLDGIRQLKSPVDEVVLYMAHLHRRFNRDMLEFFFCQTLDEAECQQRTMELLNQLKTLPFVKYINADYFVLHDEMTRLVTAHVWDTAAEDPDKTLRRELSQQACEYYQRELTSFPPLSECTEQQRITYWSLQTERTYYSLYADFQSGFYEFEALFETLVANRRSGLAALAVSFLHDFKGKMQNSALLPEFVTGYYEGGILLSLERLTEAEEKLRAGERKLARILSQIDLSQASPLDRYLSERQYMIYHQLGFCYRSLGDWEKAIKYYDQSLDLVLDLAQKLIYDSSVLTDKYRLLLAQAAETLNSLANVHRLVGHFDEARLLCQNSIFLRRSWEPHQVARSQYVMAMILWEMGATAEAMGYLRRAEQTCPPGDESLQALIKKHRAYILFRTGLSERAVPLLLEAEAVFRKRGNFTELADALKMLSRIFRDHPEAVEKQLDGRDPMQIAKDYVDEAHGIARQIGDRYRLAECRLTKAFHYHKWSQIEPSHAQSYREQALSHWRQGYELATERFNRFLSLFSQVRGDIAFRTQEPDYDLAFDQYTQQCMQATQFKRAVYERSVDSIGDRLRELGSTEPLLAKRYIRKITKEWSRDRQLVRNYPELIEELDEIRQAIEETEQLRRLRNEYEQAMLDGRWNQAIEACDSILDIPSLYDDMNRAKVILDKIRAAHRLGDLAQARRLAKIVLQIGQELQMPSLIGHAHLSLAEVLWDTTSTAEAAERLDQAEAEFKAIEDDIGLARVKRLRSYILFRTGFSQEPQERLYEALDIFEQNNLDAEVTDVLNVLSRIERTKSHNPDPTQARKYANQGLKIAQTIGDSYRVAECYLSLAILAFVEHNYQRVLEYYEEGINWLQAETHLLLSVYSGIRGAALLKLGLRTEGSERKNYMEQAFDSLLSELIESTKSKPASIVRALGLIYEFFMQLPTDEARVHAQRLKDAWQRQQMDRDFPIVTKMCDHVIRYHVYINYPANPH